MKNILIADDHPVIRLGVQRILMNYLDGLKFGEADNAAQVWRKIKRKRWDLLILDIDMPGRSGREVLSQIKAEKIKLPVLVFSTYPEEQTAGRMYRAGAQGYLSKTAPETELVYAVQQLLDGKKYVPPGVLERLTEQVADPSLVPRHENLSDREYDTLLLIAQGKSISQIAKSLFLSIPAISTFRHRILRKMEMENNAELIKYVINNQLV